MRERLPGRFVPETIVSVLGRSVGDLHHSFETMMLELIATLMPATGCFSICFTPQLEILDVLVLVRA
jgi:hypothetical protein